MDININPNQHQELPGEEKLMQPRPIYNNENYKGSQKLANKVAVITGGDSGIGRAVAIAYAKEGARLVLAYLCEDQDAKDTQKEVEAIGTECLLIKGDLSDSKHCKLVISQTLTQYGQIDILVNHAGEQYQTNSLEDITDKNLQRIFEVNVFSMFYLTKEAVKYMKEGAVIINTVSIVAYKGNPSLLDYSATKGANLSFTRALASYLAKSGIRINGVAPGPIWTPLIPSSFSPKKLEKFGKDTLLKRPGQPYELAPAYVYLASEADSSYVTGQVIHVNGGIIVNS